MNIKKNMLVRIANGNNKGMEGKVLSVFPNKELILVEGVNFKKRASRPTQENPSGGFIEREAPIHVSNVMVLHGGQPTTTLRGHGKLCKVQTKLQTSIFTVLQSALRVKSY